MKRLKFEHKQGLAEEVYEIWNRNDQYLGDIKRIRVGSWMHWCFCPVAVDTTGDVWFTNGCLKEIIEFISSLYNRKETELKAN